MLASAALVLPVVLLSLFYIRQMNDAVGRIADRDIEIIHIGNDIALNLAQARRDDKNFLLYRDTICLVHSHESLDRVKLLADSGLRLDPEAAAEFETISQLTEDYRALLDSLPLLPVPPPTGPVFVPGAAELRRSHIGLLQQAAAAEDPVRRDSLLGKAALLAERIMLSTSASRQLDDALHLLQQRITAGSDTVVARALSRIGTHRRTARRFATWGQRNIVTILLLTIVVLVWLLVVLPRQAVLPIRRITNALRRAEEGDLDVKVKLASNDELGRLAGQLNRSFARLREFDERKVERILQLERRFRLLINDISEGVIVVDRTPTILLANPAVEELLGHPVSEAQGRKLQSCPGLVFILGPLERALAGATAHQTCEVLPELPGSAVCIEALRNRAGDVTGALIIISNPQRPEPVETPPA